MIIKYHFILYFLYSIKYLFELNFIVLCKRKLLGF